MAESCNKKHPVLAVVGPTATGKTALGDTLAEAHRKAVNTAAYVCTANGAWPEYPDTMPDYLAQAAQ